MRAVVNWSLQTRGTAAPAAPGPPLLATGLLCHSTHSPEGRSARAVPTPSLTFCREQGLKLSVAAPKIRTGLRKALAVFGVLRQDVHPWARKWGALQLSQVPSFSKGSHRTASSARLPSSLISAPSTPASSCQGTLQAAQPILPVSACVLGGWCEDRISQQPVPACSALPLGT